MRHAIFGLFAGLLMIGTANVLAADPVSKTVGELYEQRSDLNGQRVTVTGEVVKVNNKIMGRNFLHLRDGTGDEGSSTHDLTFTSQDTTAVGSKVRVTGTVVVDRDFGAGYVYPLLLEESTFTETR